MNLRKGIYRSVAGYKGTEKHGGAEFTWTDFAFLCFYLPEKRVGYYLGPRDNFNPYLEDNYRYRGEITVMYDNQIEIVINDPFVGGAMIFSGQMIDEKLHLAKKRQSNPDKILREDVFEFVEEVPHRDATS